MTLKPKLYIITYRSYPYSWIYYSTHQDLLIFIEKKIENSSKFYFKLEFSNFHKIFFAMNSKYGYLFMVFSKDFYITYSLKSFLKGHVWN
jgi:hypothetical protein